MGRADHNFMLLTKLEKEFGQSKMLKHRTLERGQPMQACPGEMEP